MTIAQVPQAELQMRMTRFRSKMDTSCPDWEIAVIFGKVNQYFFTGTMQDGMLIIPRNAEAILWVRRSYERAKDESLFPDIRPMESFRDAAGSVGKLPAAVYLETELVPLAMYQRFRKHFPFAEVRAVDPAVRAVRAIKSPYELDLLIKAGVLHQRSLEVDVPAMLREGMSETELCTELFAAMLAQGHHGVSRFEMFDTQVMLGQIGFGESSIYPTSFNGPGGNYGMCPASPMLGSRERRLKKGDLVFVDTGFGIEGYHSDKTMTYMFGHSLSQEVIAIHHQCVDVQDQVAAMLKPGIAPSEIYRTIMQRLSPEFLKDFMGFGSRQVKFLGHGVGLTVDEPPVIAEGFDEPLQEGMVMAVEPKKGIAGVGMVGIENTFLVTPNGGRCITGESCGLIPVY
ncbi:MAG: Xaa-Pro peptidase family protein [Verrucomicrobiota bacterium]